MGVINNDFFGMNIGLSMTDPLIVILVVIAKVLDFFTARQQRGILSAHVPYNFIAARNRWYAAAPRVRWTTEAGNTQRHEYSREIFLLFLSFFPL